MCWRVKRCKSQTYCMKNSHTGAHKSHRAAMQRWLLINIHLILFVSPLLPPFCQCMSYQSASICAPRMKIRSLNTDNHLPPILVQTTNDIGARLNILTALWQRCQPLWAVKVLYEQSGWSRPGAKVDDTDRHYGVCVCVCSKMCLLQHRFLSPAESKNLIGNRGAYYSQR